MLYEVITRRGLDDEGGQLALVERGPGVDAEAAERRHEVRQHRREGRRLGGASAGTGAGRAAQGQPRAVRAYDGG